MTPGRGCRRPRPRSAGPASCGRGESCTSSTIARSAGHDDEDEREHGHDGRDPGQEIQSPALAARGRRRGGSGREVYVRAASGSRGTSCPAGGSTGRRTSVARTDTPPCVCRMPSTSSTSLVTTTWPWVSNRSGRMVMFTSPVSSSRVRNTKPLAVPGRWRQMTAPATRTRAPSRSRARSKARLTPRASKSVSMQCHRMRPDGEARPDDVAFAAVPSSDISVKGDTSPSDGSCSVFPLLFHLHADPHA